LGRVRTDSRFSGLGFGNPSETMRTMFWIYWAVIVTGLVVYAIVGVTVA